MSLLYEIILLESKDQYVVKAFGPKIVDQWFTSTGKVKPKGLTPEKVSELALEFVQTSLMPLDPTPNQKFLVWIAKLYADGNLKQEDFYKVPEELTLFAKVQQKLPVKDIMQYKSLPDLVDATEPFASLDEPVSNKAKAKAEREQQLEGADHIYSSPTLTIYSPNTQEAACQLGKGTKWCTAATRSYNAFDSYDSSGVLYVFFLTPSPPNGPFQMHLKGAKSKKQLPAMKERSSEVYIADKADRTISSKKFLSLLNQEDLAVVTKEILKPEEPTTVEGVIKKYGKTEIKKMPLEYRAPFLVTIIHAMYAPHSSAKKSYEASLNAFGGLADFKKVMKSEQGPRYAEMLIKGRPGTTFGKLDRNLHELLTPILGKKKFSELYMKTVTMRRVFPYWRHGNPLNTIPRAMLTSLNIGLKEYLNWLLADPKELRGRSDVLRRLAELISNRAITAASGKELQKIIKTNPEVRKKVVDLISHGDIMTAIYSSRKDSLKEFLTSDEKEQVVSYIKNSYLKRKAGVKEESLPSITSLQRIFKNLTDGNLDKDIFADTTPAQAAERLLSLYTEPKNGWFQIAFNPDIQKKVFGSTLSPNKDVTVMSSAKHYTKVMRDRYIIYSVSELTGKEWITVVPFDKPKSKEVSISIDQSGVKLYDLNNLEIKNEELAQQIQQIRKIGKQKNRLQIDRDATLESKVR